MTQSSIIVALACALVLPQSAAGISSEDRLATALSRVAASPDSESVALFLSLARGNGKTSARFFLSQLRVIPETKIVPESIGAHQSSLRVVWSIRGLRYITGGLTFAARTNHRWTVPEQDRRHFLSLQSRERLPFFSTTMSHDVIYVAPVDAQATIIEKWRYWSVHQSDRFIFVAADSYELWYF